MQSAGDFYLAAQTPNVWAAFFLEAAVLYQNEQEVKAVVERFEWCSYALQEFTHPRHITVSVWYLSQMDFEEAMARMRCALMKFSAHHNKMGYNETITRFWLVMVNEFLAAAKPEASMAELANGAVNRFGDKNLLFQYYSRERVQSEEAKGLWIQPDLQEMGARTLD